MRRGVCHLPMCRLLCQVRSFCLSAMESHSHRYLGATSGRSASRRTPLLRLWLVPIALFVASSVVPHHAVPSARPYGQPAYFHETGCDKCKAAEKWLSRFYEGNPDRRIVRFDMKRLDSIERRREYDEAYAVPDSKCLRVPALFAGGEAYIGVDAIRDFVEGRGRSRRSPLQRAADHYGPTALRWLLVASLLAVAAGAATNSRRWHGAIGNAVRVVLASVLFVSAVSKAADPSGTAKTIAEQWPFVGAVAAPVVVSLAVAEATVGLALLVGRPRVLARWAPLGIFAVFLLYAVASRLFHVSGDCGCFPWREDLGWSTVARNLGFVVLSWSVVAIPVPPAVAPIGEAPCTST